MKISIIVPAYNEEKTLKQIVEKVKKIDLNQKYEIILINDGSTDKTLEIAKKLTVDSHLKLITNKQNIGKGGSIVKALKISKGEIIVIQDADLEYEPKDLPKLLAPFEDKKVNVVYGSRKLMKNSTSSWTFDIGGRLITFITNILYGTNITDEATGYKLYRKIILNDIRLNAKGFEFCPEITAKIAKIGQKIHEIPIHYYPRPVNEKKIKWKDGMLAIYYLFKYRVMD